MKLFKCLLLGMGAIAAGTAMAQDTGTTSVAKDDPDSFRQVTLRNEVFGFRPQIGFMNFGSRTTDDNTRLAVGAIVEANAMKWFGVELEGEEANNWWLGPSTGVIYSHIGQTDTGFFGVDGWPGNDLGSNVVVVPLNVKVAYFVIPELRVGVHGGANMIYRSNAAAIQLQSAGETGSNFDVFPNLGLDAEIPLGAGAITIRPDMTFTPGENVFVGNVGYSWSFG